MGANVNQGGSHAAYIWYKNGDVFAPQAVVGINFIQDDEVGTRLCVCVCVCDTNVLTPPWQEERAASNTTYPTLPP